jgi:hypothetical protein
MIRGNLAIKKLEQVNKIRHRLDKGEQVQFIARQSKHRPGGSFTTPDTIFVTNKRIVIRDPSLLGVKGKYSIRIL